MIIKWRRLNRLAERETGKKVVISLTTSSGIKDFVALVEKDMGVVSIFLNGNVCKSEDSVIDAEAHELAHVVLNHDQHGEDHTAKWLEIRERITKEYRRVKNEI